MLPAWVLVLLTVLTTAEKVATPLAGLTSDAIQAVKATRERSLHASSSVPGLLAQTRQRVRGATGGLVQPQQHGGAAGSPSRAGADRKAAMAATGGASR